jgi:hypothetical protein
MVPPDTHGNFFRGMIFSEKPVSTPHHVRGRLFPDHALMRDNIEIAIILTSMVQRAKPLIL